MFESLWIVNLKVVLFCMEIKFDFGLVFFVFGKMSDFLVLVEVCKWVEIMFCFLFVFKIIVFVLLLKSIIVLWLVLFNLWELRFVFIINVFFILFVWINWLVIFNVYIKFV